MPPLPQNPVVVPPPLIIPSSPPPPTDFQKMLPTYVKMVGMAVMALGGWIQTVLAPDADFQAVFPNAHDAIGIIVAVLGGIGTLCSTFVSTWNNNKFQAVIDHKDMVITATTDVATQTAEIAQTAAAAPAIIPPGIDPIKFRLKLALNEAVDRDNDEMIDGIRLLMRKKAGAA
jgi:hypothetical protein